jgi:DNA polymerase elongation subunit (family B)
MVHLWDDEKGYSTFPYVPYAYKRQAGGKHRSIYGDELTKIFNVPDNDPNLFESDVSADMRVLLDLYPDSDELSKGHKLGVIDIEVSTIGGFPNMETANREVLGITIYDAVTQKYTVFLLDKEGKIERKDTPEIQVKTYDDEDNLLMAFVDKWQECGFTIVTGWNVDYFDMPYLYTRLKAQLGAKVAKFLSPIGVAYINGFTKKLTLGGISVLDYILLYKKFTNRMEPSYALGPIGKKVVGMDKLHYRGSLDDLYKEDVEKFLEYNLNDVKIVVALDKKLQFIELARQICHVGHVPYEYFHMSSRYLDGAILMFLKRNGGLIAPDKPARGREEYEAQQEDGEEGFTGAYVKEPVPGRYDWVFDLDLTSMYPNIIISLNISPETKVAKLDRCMLPPDSKVEKRMEILKELQENGMTWTGNELDREKWIERKCNEFDMDYHVRGKIESYRIAQTPYSKDEFHKLVQDSFYSLSSNGVLYRQDKRGIIPTILQKWFEERIEMRKKAADARKAGMMDAYHFYNQRQQVWKILLNSMYGVLGLPIFRFYDIDNAEAVTKTGVSIIQTTAKAINQFYQTALGKSSGDWVIYTDTDSCFVDAIPIIKKRFPEIDFKDEKAMTDAIMTVTTDVQQYVNTFYNVMAKRFFNLDKHAFDAKQEVISKTSFWLAKKRYAQWIIHKEGHLLKEPELEVKGIDVVRTSFPAAFRKFMETFLKKMLGGTPKAELDSTILDFKEEIKHLPVLDIAKNTSVKYVSKDGVHNYNPEERKPFQIIKGTPAQTKAALHYNDILTKWELTKHCEPIKHGQKIKWVYLTSNPYGIELIALKGDDTDADKMVQFVDTYVDRSKMFEQELKSKMMDFYKVFKWEFPNPSMAIADQFFG